MDDNRLDAMVRSVASLRSRRMLLGTALGITSGGFLTAFGLQRSQAQGDATPIASSTEPPESTPNPTTTSIKSTAETATQTDSSLPSPTTSQSSSVPHTTATAASVPQSSSKSNVVPAAALTPKISLSPASGVASVSVTAAISGFKKSEKITITWFNGSSSRSIGVVIAASSGNATKAFPAIDSVRGPHKVIATGSSGSKAENTFTISPRILLSSTSGSAGQKLVVSLTGFAASTMVELRWFEGTKSTGKFNVLGTTKTSSSGAASKSITLPSVTAHGEHRVEAKELANSTKTATLFTITTVTLNQRLAVPAYFEAESLWAKLGKGAPKVGLVVINPKNGPGDAFDQAYADHVSGARSVGIIVLGYVSTDYAKRSRQTAATEADRYYAWYGVDGIFFDEASTDCTKATTYYKPLFEHIKAKPGRAMVALNPGTTTSECYMSVSDIVLTFEDSGDQYASYALAGWEKHYAPERFWHLIYAVKSEEAMRTAIEASKLFRAGWVYATPDDVPNPWDTLPSAYWNTELALLQS